MEGRIGRLEEELETERKMREETQRALTELLQRMFAKLETQIHVILFLL